MSHRLEVRDLQPAFGSELVGLDPTAPIDADTAAQLRDVFDDRGLLVVRDEDLSLEFQRELSYALIGEPLPTDLPERRQKPYFVSNKEPEGGAPFGRLLYHSDGMWQERPFDLLSLYAVDLEPPVAPTCFASTVHAWETLPDDVRARVRDLHVEHGHDATYARGNNDGDVLVATFQDKQSTITPLAREHPRTGRTMLYASQMMTTRIVELSKEESEELLEEVFTYLYAVENTLEFDWQVGDLVLWDNLALQHARPNVTVEGPVRTLRKVFAPAPVVTGNTGKPVQRTRASA